MTATLLLWIVWCMMCSSGHVDGSETKLRGSSQVAKSSSLSLSSSSLRSLTGTTLDPTEKTILQCFYDATGGPNTWSTVWDITSDPCQNSWVGVGCICPQSQSVCSVQQLSLTSNNLQGTIPTCLFGLVGLQRLTLSHNRLSGTIPSAMQLLTDIMRVDLSVSGSTRSTVYLYR
jgi:Leucine rich repeat